MSGGGRISLLHRLQRIIERTYDLDTGLRDISPFIIGDEGFTRLYGGRQVSRSVGTASRDAKEASPGSSGMRGALLEPGARTLLREEGGSLKVSVYYPDRLIENLERHDPARSLFDGNVDDFATLVEELDHLLTFADRHRAGAEVSLLELELHANVTKELVMMLFVARMNRRRWLEREERSWIRHHLFGKVEYREDEPELQSRYRDAASLAVRYLDSLQTLPAADRPRELRRFHRRTHHEKLAAIGRL